MTTVQSSRTMRQRWLLAAVCLVGAAACALSWAWPLASPPGVDSSRPSALPSSSRSEGSAHRDVATALDRSAVGLNEPIGTTHRVVRVLDPTNQAIAGASVLVLASRQSSTAQWTLTTDASGACSLGTATGRALAVHHPDHAVLLTDCSEEQEQVVQLRPKPRFFCRLEGVTTAEVQAHRFVVSVVYDPRRYPVLDAVRRLATNDMSTAYEWDGEQALEVVAPCDAEAIVMVTASWRDGPTGTRHPYGRTSHTVSPPLAGKTVHVGFPVRLPTAYGSPRIVASLRFPEAVTLEASISGPLAAIAPVPVPFGIVVRSCPVQPDGTMDAVVPGLPFGDYSLAFTAPGYGFYEVGTFAYSGQDVVRLANQDTFCNVAVAVEPLPGTDNEAVMRVRGADSGFSTGATFKAATGGEFAFIVPRNRPLLVEVTEAGGRRIIRHTEIAGAVAGARFSLPGWEDCFEYSCDTREMGNARREPVWVAVTDEGTGARFRTRAFAPGKKIPVSLAKGLYALRVMARSGELWSTVLRVPDEPREIVVR